MDFKAGLLPNKQPAIFPPLNGEKYSSDHSENIYKKVWLIYLQFNNLTNNLMKANKVDTEQDI